MNRLNKNLILIPAAVAALLYGGCKNNEYPTTVLNTPTDYLACTADENLESKLEDKGYVTETKIFAKADDLPGNIVAPGCYMTAHKPGSDETEFYSVKRKTLLGAFRPISDPKGQWEWISANHGARRVYASADPASYLFEERIDGDGLVREYSEKHRPTLRVEVGRLEAATEARGFSGINSMNSAIVSIDKEVRNGRYFIISSDKIVDGMIVERTGSYVSVGEECKGTVLQNPCRPRIRHYDAKGMHFKD